MEESMMMHFLSEYYGRDNGRTAQIHADGFGYYVQMYQDGNMVKRVPLYEQSRDYAEDCAENWTLGIINE
jgi:hypothetical protein